MGRRRRGKASVSLLDVYQNSFNARESFTMEYRLRRSDGEYCWLLDSGTPRFPPDGVLFGYIGSCIDITERKAAEEEARRRREQVKHQPGQFAGEMTASLAHDSDRPLAAILSNATAAMQYLKQGVRQQLQEILTDVVDGPTPSGVLRNICGVRLRATRVRADQFERRGESRHAHH